MTYYCINCWAEVKRSDVVCSTCGADQEELNRESYVNKLIRALHHPVPETSLRAAHILGSMKSSAAVPALSKLATRAVDPFLRAAAIEALGNIGDTRVTAQLRRQLSSSPTLVEQGSLARAIAKLSEGKKSTT